MRPYIKVQRCDGCGECIDTCPYDVFSLEKGKIIVMNPEDCIECLSCIEQCAEKAIYMDD
ncbi:MAG TPA: 4Fe-4S binding protein [Syntrophorhabdaceae bacterium]|nr:4Fe-4S binding protein [Syntrophorhabdaceae bacterium]MDI9561116.1 4Fe-4S binding protein [Pseudomonadota bacterium]HNQ62931.1 4Fe-4S binding protein [Syntrophorhabdaceae bacterium]HNZ57799.1 4Fe-4S binding protein [Syntrophorhabdaceae bacterium]HQI55456.1 4Fe-4S binding protein [Syntrophorhabdaceae bacterium]